MNWIISYPRSGSNWLAYILGAVCNIPINGHRQEWREGRLQEGIIQKRHDFKHVERTDKVIFVIRNYRECIYSFGHGKGDLHDFYVDQIQAYYKLLAQYENHIGPKHLIFYEWLMLGKSDKLNLICNDLGANPFNYYKFFKDEQKHRDKSLTLYGHEHVKGITGVKNPIWDNIAQADPHASRLYQKYLARYV